MSGDSEADDECHACEDTGLLDPYGAFGLRGGPCPECEPATAEPPAWQRKPVTHEWARGSVGLSAVPRRALGFVDVVELLSDGWTVHPWAVGVGCPATRPVEREESSR